MTATTCLIVINASLEGSRTVILVRINESLVHYMRQTQALIKLKGENTISHSSNPPQLPVESYPQLQANRTQEPENGIITSRRGRRSGGAKATGRGGGGRSSERRGLTNSRDSSRPGGGAAAGFRCARSRGCSFQPAREGRVRSVGFVPAGRLAQLFGLLLSSSTRSPASVVVGGGGGRPGGYPSPIPGPARVAVAEWARVLVGVVNVDCATTLRSRRIPLPCC